MTSYDDASINCEKHDSACAHDIQSRNMGSIGDKSYADETIDDELQNGDESSEERSNEKPSPIAGRISGSMEDLERMQGTEETTSDEVRECLKDSVECYQTCTATLTSA